MLPRLLPKAYGRKPLIDWLPFERCDDVVGAESEHSPLLAKAVAAAQNHSMLSRPADVKRQWAGRKVSILYGSPSLDWMESKHGEELVIALREGGADAEVIKLKYSGHLLFLDEPDEFADKILLAYDR